MLGRQLSFSFDIVHTTSVVRSLVETVALTTQQQWQQWLPRQGRLQSIHRTQNKYPITAKQKIAWRLGLTYTDGRGFPNCGGGICSICGIFACLSCVWSVCLSVQNVCCRSSFLDQMLSSALSYGLVSSALVPTSLSCCAITMTRNRKNDKGWKDEKKKEWERKREMVAQRTSTQAQR